MFKKEQYTMKESRTLISHILRRACLAKMNRTLLLTELIAKNEGGEFS